MKLALLVGGMLRQHAIARLSWNLVTDFSPDIYFSTWDKSVEINPGLSIYNETTVTVDQIIQPATVSITSATQFNYSSNFRKQMHHWKVLVEMLPDKYDYVIVTRPDLYFHTNRELFLNFLNNIENDTIYTLHQVPAQAHIDDLMLISKSDVFSTFVRTTDFSKIDIGTRVHNWLYEEFKKTLNIKKIKGITNIAICRATCNELDDFYSISKKASEWWKGLGCE